MTRYELFGIGIGPFNLSLAALADSIGDLRCRFAERRARFAWHPGLMIPGAMMQTSFLKDMVTPVLPTSRWSFLNYLVSQGRFFDFMAGRHCSASRAEFSDYMGWVAHGLNSTGFGDPVEAVSHDGRGFTIHARSGQSWRSRAVSVGVGLQPNIPDFAPAGPDCLHASRWLDLRPSLAGRRVAVIGGGQSGAEIVLDLLRRPDAPAAITWISRRSGYWTLQDGAFIDQFFTPDYVTAWRQQSETARAAVLAEQKYASDGITPATANAIYDALYQRRREGRQDVTLQPGREVCAIRRTGTSYRIEARVVGGNQPELCHADVVVLATGYRQVLPDCLEPLAGRLQRQADGGLALDAQYRVIWDGPRQTPLYAMNHGRHSHGIADPQISLAAWRSAVILNDLTGQRLFRTRAETGSPTMIDWPGQAEKCGVGLDKFATHA
ncbi:lysine N(6)-hydroxylase/L-ornithine N(5)-oxygenase family protein [Paracoccus fistulariae]|uniref:SidA/IucD/PvdA family monooxygenase n=1 Tax=Paracoccus fistulariae TaxID=658446 RepID=A0ABY7SIT0_9RHOB|nr:SidA/IucD/PvdA family monooxygenase [Paracoccus fistulariae]MDB6181775.1 SidA/IucD/PvdA family monooxygenase [Paracoccus fistulariae]WCR05932.1 SidA/IucD/PvdA family monooxygenase [Paracoccus fistulariae]